MARFGAVRFGCKAHLMKLAVSNIAWPADQRDAAYGVLKEAEIRGLEIAPGLFLNHAADPFDPSERELAEALAPLNVAGLELVSMQSLLFGTQGAALFGSPAERDIFVMAMLRAIALARRLGIPNLVFGSPRQRSIPAGMPEVEAMEIALDTFRKLGDAAIAAGTRIAIEPNDASYGTNFLNRTGDALAFVRHVDHPGIVLNFDLGALHEQGDFEQIEAIALAAADCIGHVHFSESRLAAAPADAAQAQRALTALAQAGYSGWHSIEMAATDDALNTLRSSVARLQSAALPISPVRTSHEPK